LKGEGLKDRYKARSGSLKGSFQHPTFPHNLTDLSSIDQTQEMSSSTTTIDNTTSYPHTAEVRLTPVATSSGLSIAATVTDPWFKPRRENGWKAYEGDSSRVYKYHEPSTPFSLLNAMNCPVQEGSLNSDMLRTLHDGGSVHVPWRTDGSVVVLGEAQQGEPISPATAECTSRDRR
jgi:hypothetical protein